MPPSRTENVWYLPQHVYDDIMSRPDGADLSDLFEFEDPAWKMTITKGRKMSSNPCAKGHNWVPGAPVQHPDGSQSPRLICTRCPAEKS